MARKPVFLLLAVAVALFACQAQPVVETESKPKRKSFADPNWQQAEAAPEPSDDNDTQARAGEVREAWDRARDAKTDAEREEAIRDALKRSQELADQPSGSGQ
jgi:hypothetical protein